MTPNLQNAKDILESKLRQILTPRAWRDAIAIRHCADLADITQQAGEREMASRDLDRNAGLLRDVRAALDRIHDGSYGNCVECGEPIASKRLAALPWTRYCLSCQAGLEAAASRDDQLAA